MEPFPPNALGMCSLATDDPPPPLHVDILQVCPIHPKGNKALQCQHTSGTAFSEQDVWLGVLNSKDSQQKAQPFMWRVTSLTRLQITS